MSQPSYGTIIRDGLWNNNQGLVAILGLCPLLAVSNSAVNGLGLGLATTLVLMSTNLVISLIRHWARPEIRVPIYVVLIAGVVTAIELAMKAYLHELYLVLGIFIPLIVTNCVVMARAEAFASRNSPDRAVLDGLSMGAGFTAVLVLLGMLRELLGKGTLFDQAQKLFGAGADWMTVTLFEDYHGFLLAILPPGAFFGLGLLIALKNLIDARRKERAEAVRQPQEAAA